MLNRGLQIILVCVIFCREINAESLEEIYVDKILAFALRQGRIKSRDLWDLTWLRQRSIEPALELLSNKLQDHNVAVDDFLRKGAERVNAVLTERPVKVDFRNEMRRFLPAEMVAQTVDNERFWDYLANEIDLLVRRAESSLINSKESDDSDDSDRFVM
ncbi:nucleotidyl transferase AbiEii/AbiGii toxin family protein [Pseudomonas sp. OTU5201]|uniref:nucleotidyl transferase AbiEii/AbiGii toxin family protein n=1 Tax=Pseudomonas sp. OTU5201 TaxID=3043850 RepID=UPI00313CC2F1